jgi:predicted enzyme related to lactoylglutathione lyase
VSARFSSYVLRTTDAPAATKFYATVLEHCGDRVVPLHEAALARGARPHWLGQIGVRELGGAEAVSARFVERGAERFGPPAGTADFVVLRDPGGAILSLTDSSAESKAGAVWHQLNTREAARAAENYSELLGWSVQPSLDLGALGQHRRFAFAAGEATVGWISDVEGRPGVHAHWLFFFGVPALDEAVRRVREHAGVVIGPLELPHGVRVAVCDDPQGAAFGLIEREHAAKLATMEDPNGR